MGIVVGAAVPAWWEPARAEPVRSRLVEAYAGKRGTTLTLHLENAPFPCPGASYRDPTTIVFVPNHYRMPKSGKVDTVVHFHGHSTTAKEAMVAHQLREQFYESKQNAILVIPQGPVNANSGRGGKLDKPDGLLDFLTDLRKTLQTPEVRKELGRSAIRGRARIGMLCLSAHSGGYHVAAMCLRHGGFPVTEVYLFDALYGNVSDFSDWLVAGGKGRGNKRKLVSYYGGGRVGANNDSLMRVLDQAGVEYRHEKKEGTLTRAEFTTARAVFVRTRVGHSDATNEYNSFRDCLFASGLRRRLRSQWFDEKDKKRALDRRSPE